MKSFSILSVLWLGAEVVFCYERCDPASLSQAVAVCCGAPPNLNKEPLLFSALSSGHPEVTGSPVRCTTVTGMMIVPPAPSVCCPGPHGRTCCYVSPSRSQPSGEWPFQSEDSDLWSYVLATVIIVTTMSFVTLIAYCCQAVVERSRRNIKRNKYQEISNQPCTSQGFFTNEPSYQNL